MIHTGPYKARKLSIGFQTDFCFGMFHHYFHLRLPNFHFLHFLHYFRPRIGIYGISLLEKPIVLRETVFKLAFDWASLTQAREE